MNKYIFVIFCCVLLSSCSDRRKPMGEADARLLESYKINKSKEVAAYAVYFSGKADEADEAEGALLEYVRFLNQLPGDKDSQIYRYTGLTFALARLEFIRAYINDGDVNLGAACEAYSKMEELRAGKEVNKAKFRLQLIDILKNEDGSQVPWMNDRLIDRAKKMNPQPNQSRRKALMPTEGIDC